MLAYLCCQLLHAIHIRTSFSNLIPWKWSDTVSKQLLINASLRFTLLSPALYVNWNSSFDISILSFIHSVLKLFCKLLTEWSIGDPQMNWFNPFSACIGNSWTEIAGLYWVRTNSRKCYLIIKYKYPAYTGPLTYIFPYLRRFVVF